MNKFYSLLAILSISFSFHSCQEEQKKAIPPTTVTVVSAVETNLPIYREFVGSIYGYKDIPIRARVEGFLESINFEEGSQVKKGQLLYTIDSQPFEAEVAASRSNVAEAETKLVNAENELARYKPLADSKAVSQSDVDAAQATRDAAEASLHAAEANLEMSVINLSYASMKSPINGIIGRTAARVGEYVGRDPNPVILNTVSRLDTVRVQFYLSESQYLQIMRGYLKHQHEMDTQEPETEISLKLSDGSIYEHLGSVDFVDRNIEETTGAILVQASFPNPDRILRPGLYAKVKILFNVDKGSIVIPQRSVVEIQGQYSVMVLTDSNTVKSRQIVVGEKIQDSWQIKEGLKKGDRVIVSGLQKVRGGSKVIADTAEYEFTIKQ